MMKITAAILFFFFCLQHTTAQNNYGDFTQTIRSLYQTNEQNDLDKVWDGLVSLHKLPLVSGDSVAFLYRGDAKSVTWMGDFNGWGNHKKFNNKGTRIPGTDIWVLKAKLPKDARLDYKILINDSHLIIDPLNPSNQWSGVAGGSLNSELRMPEWQEDPLTTYPLDDAPHGKIQRDMLFNSRELGYQITYSIYTPARYRDDEAYSILYVTDGYEYMHERLGNMITTLDNLIHLQKIQPLIVVFLDHREPVNRSVNRRIQELAMNEKYLNFVRRELIPAVEQKYSIAKGRSHRAIIGSSLGGLSAAWFAFSDPESFGMAGMQSPAFWFKPEIYTLCENAEIPPLKLFMSSGVIHDAEEAARRMNGILKKRTLDVEFREVNQGHSWGNWRDLIDDMLIYLFPSGM